jgi:hypothetical protein
MVLEQLQLRVGEEGRLRDIRREHLGTQHTARREGVGMGYKEDRWVVWFGDASRCLDGWAIDQP